jgi:hypothetical protein
MGTTPRGIMGGELSLLNGIPAHITAYQAELTARQGSLPPLSTLEAVHLLRR